MGQCVVVRTAVCGSAYGSERTVRTPVCGSALGSVWQCGSACVAVRQCAAVRQNDSVRQCGNACVAAQQCVAVRAAVCGSARLYGIRLIRLYGILMYYKQYVYVSCIWYV
jgi:hypothetical protein